MSELEQLLTSDGFSQSEKFPCHWIAAWDDQAQFFITDGAIEKWDHEEKIWYPISMEYLTEYLTSE